MPVQWLIDCESKGSDPMNDESADERHTHSSEARFNTWVQTATKFFVLANAGAAVATLSFLATRIGSGAVQIVGILALACFVAGIIVAGFTIMGQLTAAWRRLLSSSLPPDAVELAVSKSWVTRYSDKAEPRTARLMVLAFGLFVLGCVLGLISLAVTAF